MLTIKEIEDALTYMFGSAIVKGDITEYEENKLIKCSDTIKQAVGELKQHREEQEQLVNDYNDIGKQLYLTDNDLMLYKKVFDLISQDYFNSQGGFYFKDIKTLKEKYLKEARKKLLGEIIDVKIGQNPKNIQQ